MARLPDPVMEEIEIYNPDDVAERMKTFYSTLKGAVRKAEVEEKKKENRKEV